MHVNEHITTHTCKDKHTHTQTYSLTQPSRSLSITMAK